MHRPSLFALVGALMLTACAVPTAKVGTTGTATGPAGPGATPWPVLSSGPATGNVPRAAVQTGVTLSGAVKVPAGLVAAGSGNLVAAGSGNLVAAGSGNLVAAGGMNYSLSAVEESAAAGVEVYLADAAGNAIPGLERGKTDAQGNFTILNVPSDFTFVVACDVETKDGKKATFQTLAKPGKLGATANLDAATTLVASNVLEAQKGGELGEFNPAVFKTATEATAKSLDAGKLPDFSDRAAVKAMMAGLMESVTGLKEAVSQLRTEIVEVKKSLEDLRAELEKVRTANANPGTLPPGELPPPGTFMPPPGTVLPPPGTMLPPPGTELPPGASPLPGTAPMECRPVSHQFVLPATAALAASVAYIEFKIPSPDKPPEEWMTAATAKRDANFWADVPEGCPHFVMFKDASGTVIHKIENFVVRTGSAQQLSFEAPATSTSPPPSTAPSPGLSPAPIGTKSPISSFPPTDTTVATCTTPVEHVFKIDAAIKGTYLGFYPPATSATQPQPIAKFKVNADGTFTGKVPEGCSHDIKLYDEGGVFLGGLKGFTVPKGASRDVVLRPADAI